MASSGSSRLYNMYSDNNNTDSDGKVNGVGCDYNHDSNYIYVRLLYASIGIKNY